MVHKIPEVFPQGNASVQPSKYKHLFCIWFFISWNLSALYDKKVFAYICATVFKYFSASTLLCRTVDV